MKKNNFLTIFSFVIVCIAGILIGVLMNYQNSEDTSTSDSKKFYQEIINLNGKENTELGNTYLEVSLSEENLYTYLTSDNIDSVLNGDSVLLLGSTTNNLTRSVILPLEEVCSNYNVKSIYYLNLVANEPRYYLDETGLVQEKSSSELYKLLQTKLDSYLKPYVLEDSDGKVYDTEEKLINYPTVVFIKEGTILGVVTLNGEDTSKEDLQTKYVSYLEKLVETCDEKC